MQTYLDSDDTDLCDLDELSALLQLADDVMDMRTLSAMLCSRQLDDAFSTLLERYQLDDIEAVVSELCTQIKAVDFTI